MQSTLAPATSRMNLGACAKGLVRPGAAVELRRMGTKIVPLPPDLAVEKTEKKEVPVRIPLSSWLKAGEQLYGNSLGRPIRLDRMFKIPSKLKDQPFIPILDWMVSNSDLFIRSERSRGLCRTLGLDIYVKYDTRSDVCNFSGHRRNTEPVLMLIRDQPEPDEDTFGKSAVELLNDEEFRGLHWLTARGYSFASALHKLVRKTFLDVRSKTETLFPMNTVAGEVLQASDGYPVPDICFGSCSRCHKRQNMGARRVILVPLRDAA